MTSLGTLKYYADSISAKSEKGMASVKVVYNPYNAEWIVLVNWSDSSEFKTEHATLEIAKENMVKLLKGHLCENCGRCDFLVDNESHFMYNGVNFFERICLYCNQKEIIQK